MTRLHRLPHTKGTYRASHPHEEIIEGTLKALKAKGEDYENRSDYFQPYTELFIANNTALQRWTQRSLDLIKDIRATNLDTRSKGDSRIGALEKEKEALEKEKEDLNRDLLAQVAKLEADVILKEGNNTSLSEELSALRDSVREIESRNGELNALTSTLRAEMEEQKAEHLAKQKTLNKQIDLLYSYVQGIGSDYKSPEIGQEGLIDRGKPSDSTVNMSKLNLPPPSALPPPQFPQQTSPPAAASSSSLGTTTPPAAARSSSSGTATPEDEFSTPLSREQISNIAPAVATAMGDWQTSSATSRTPQRPQASPRLASSPRSESPQSSRRPQPARPSTARQPPSEQQPRSV